MPSIASEVSSSLVDYLKLFNSKSCQLILGAGATKSAAALKNINTKHLALASQALGFVIALIPYIREFIRRKPGMAGGTAMSEYDKVKRLYQDHQISIHEKLVEIMTLRAASHIKTMSNIDWDADAGREGASHYMEVLTKETISLNRALLKHMPEPTVHAIVEPVFGSYSDQWGEAFKRASPKTEAGKARLLRDAELFKSRLGGLRGGAEVSALLIKTVQDKTVVASTTTTTTTASTSESSTSAEEERT